MSGIPDDIERQLAIRLRGIKKTAQAAEERAGAVQQTRFLSSEMAALLTRQVGRELFSYYVYLGLYNWFADLGLDGLAGFMKKNADEELKHTEKVNAYLVDTNNRPALPAIEAPAPEYDSAVAVAQAALDHEISVTADWKNIHGLAVNDNDPTTMALALWFVTEQIEEEDKTMKLVQKLKLAGDGLALLQIDEMYKE